MSTTILTVDLKNRRNVLGTNLNLENGNVWITVCLEAIYQEFSTVEDIEEKINDVFLTEYVCALTTESGTPLCNWDCQNCPIERMGIGIQQ